MASGVLNTARQVGSAVGLAALGSIATAAAAGSLTKPDNFVSGMRAAMLVAGALALAASVLTLVGQPPGYPARGRLRCGRTSVVQPGKGPPDAERSDPVRQNERAAIPGVAKAHHDPPSTMRVQ